MENEYVEGLSGEEIINDVLEQVASRLRNNCNLRLIDCYMGGYEGTVEVHLKLHGFDLTEIKSSIAVSVPASPACAGTGGEIQHTEITEHVEIPLEPRLNLVRERSDQGIPSLGKDANGQAAIKKRRYIRSDKKA